MKAENLNNFKKFDDIKLPAGKTVVFEVLGIRNDPDNFGRKIIPTQLLRPFDMIMVDDEPKQIAAIERLGEDGQAILDVEMIFNPANHGRIFLEASKPKDHIRYKFMTLCNYNESNPNRDKSIEPIFRLVDEEKEATLELEKEQENFKSLEAFFILRDDEVGIISKLVGIDGEVSVIKPRLLEWVKGNPNKFKSIVDGIKDIVPEVALVQYGLANELLIDNKMAGEITYGPDKGKVVFTYDGELDVLQLANALKKENPEIIKGLKALSKK
jgi:hypothetical protein